MEKFGGPELQKYAGIDRRGRNHLKSDALEEFTTFPETLKNRFIVALEFTPESINDVEGRVFSKLRDVESNFGIKFMLSGRDYPIHSTLMEGLFEGEDENSREEIFAKLQNELLFGLEGNQVQFDYVLLDGSKLLLVAKSIPHTILEAREKLSEQYDTFGLKPLGMQNILHSSLARISQIPDQFDREKYKKEIIDLRHSVSSNPLNLTIGNVAKEQSHQYLTYK
jgi:hypothetical protein